MTKDADTARPSEDGPAKPHGDKLGSGHPPPRPADDEGRPSGDSPKRQGDPLAPTVLGAK